MNMESSSTAGWRNKSGIQEVVQPWDIPPQNGAKTRVIRTATT